MYGLEVLQDELYVGDIDPYCNIDISINDIDIPWKLPTLISIDLKNHTRMWEIAFDGENLITVHGIVNGQKQEVRRAVTINNSGKNIYQQALVEGKKRYQDKIKEGYHGVGCDTGFKVPMQAHPFNDHLKKIIGDHYLAYQYKIDGFRAITSHTSLGIVRLSRSNNPVPFMDHLDQECYQLLSYLPRGTILDGELYKFGMDFDSISQRCSVGRKERHPNSEAIDYWIFDIITEQPMPYYDRYNMLCEAYNQCGNMHKLLVMPFYSCYGSMDSIEEHLIEATKLGYEGLMIKNLTSNYVHGRTSNILKVKKFIDEEAIIVSVTSGAGTESGCALFILYDNLTNKQFPVRPQGTFDQRRYWFTNPHTVIGRFYTFKYFGKRVAGQLPRFPIGVRFRDEL